MAITRATLPEEFFDVTSARMLREPEPQYFYAQVMKRAMGISLGEMEAGGLPLPGHEIPTEGADYATAEEQRLELEKDMIAREAFIFVPELGKGPGDTVRLNRPKFTDTTYTFESRRVLPDQTISTTPTKIGSSQTSLTLDRFAGPYDADQTAVAPIAIDQYTAKFPVHKLVQVRGMQLVRDFDKTLDSFVKILFNLAANTIYPGSASALTDLITNGADPMDWNIVVRAEQKLKELGIPPFADGKWLMVLTPQQTRQLGEDAQYQRQTKMDISQVGLNPVYNASYFKSVSRFHIFESQTLTQSTTEAGTTGGATAHVGHAFGPGMIGCAMGEMPEVRQSTNTNYGNTSLCIWQWVAALGCLDNRFGLKIATD